ncbi:MAG: hypothetical protein IPJ34_44085 [Myxococcales bacterium]|nr:hypothetical protein [Myxococcales bacterium]
MEGLGLLVAFAEDGQAARGQRTRSHLREGSGKLGLEPGHDAAGDLEQRGAGGSCAHGMTGQLEPVLDRREDGVAPTRVGDVLRDVPLGTLPVRPSDPRCLGERAREHLTHEAVKGA